MDKLKNLLEQHNKLTYILANNEQNSDKIIYNLVKKLEIDKKEIEDQIFQLTQSN